MPSNQLTRATINCDTSKSDRQNNLLKMYPSILKMACTPKIKPRIILTANNVFAINDKQTFKNYSSDEKKKIATLPVPRLVDTMERFLKSCKPLLTPEELKETVKIAQSYTEKDGQACQMQDKLLERASKMENWLSDWWIKAAYLSYRNSLIGWSSPGTPFAYRKFKSEDEFLKYAANVVLGALKFKESVDKKKIKQEMMGKIPLDMQQYYKVLGTCRLPGEVEDCMQYNSNSKHIVVVCNNNYYMITVYDNDNAPIGQNQLIKFLKAIVKASKEPAPPVGVFTATNRDTWGKNFKLLNAGKCNTACIKYIQQSIFLLCLDKCIEDSKIQERNALTVSGIHTIHGGGSKHNTGNRWFDKTIQFVVCSNGHSGITYEHSPAEGGPVTSMGDFIQDYIKEGCGDHTEDVCLNDPVPRTLRFHLSGELTAALETAKNEVDKFINDFDLYVHKYDCYGKDYIKSQKLSPDSFIQMALQLAYYRLHGKPAAQYESAAMRHFLHGRTETIRSCTCEAVKFVKAMLDEFVDPCKKAEALKAAIIAHQKIVKSALAGAGVDRHLLGLRLQAKESKVEPHEFFKSVGFVKSSSFKLSTSQVPTKHEGFMGYGPSDPDGYGVCYNPRADDIIFAVGSLKSSKETNSENMANSIFDSFDQMFEVLNYSGQSKL